MSYGLQFFNFYAWFHLCLSDYSTLTVLASRLSSNILQRSFFFFARMSCSEQSAFHGQASDRAWFFSELLFQSVAAKKNELLHVTTGIYLVLAKFSVDTAANGSLKVC